MDYRLLPAHRRKLRQMRAIVDAGPVGSTVERRAAALAYLEVHASCEAYLAARGRGEWPIERPRCASGLGKRTKVKAPTLVRTCVLCNKQKSTLSFEGESGICIKCKYKLADAEKGQQQQPVARKPAPTKRRKCPVCLQSVDVKLVLDEWVVTEHTKVRAEGQVECGGAGKVVSHERRDAMDHKVAGSFEGGRRR